MMGATGQRTTSSSSIDPTFAGKRRSVDGRSTAVATYRSPGEHVDLGCGAAIEHAGCREGGDEWQWAAAEMGKVEVRR